MECRTLAKVGKKEVEAAIVDGMIGAKLKRENDRLLLEAEEYKAVIRHLRADNAKLRERLMIVQRINRERTEAEIEAFRQVIDGDSDFRRRRDFRWTIAVALFGAGVLIAMFATMIAMFAG